MQVPPRDRQSVILRAALENPRPLPIFLHGPPATGKRASLKASLNPDTTETHVDCVLSHSDRLLFSAVLGRDCSPHPCDLVFALSDNIPSTNHVIIFHRAERLSSPSFSTSAIAVLFRLPELCGTSRIRLVFVSRTPWHIFRASILHPLQTPTTIFFPPYAETEVVAILAKCYDTNRLHTQPPPHLIKRAKQFYPGYVKSVVSVLYPTTSDLHELQRVCDDIYPLYITCGKDASASFNVVQDKLRKSLHNLYSRQVISREKQLSAEIAKSREKSDRNTQKDLSRTALTLLVSAFLASRNPPGYDMRYFTTERTGRVRSRGRGRGRGRGRLRRAEGRIAVSKVFSLERLLAIYAAIRVDEDDLVRDVNEVSVSSSLSTSSLVQISTLVALGFLARDGGGDLISEPKYRSNISEEQVQEISNLLRIELHQYWHKE